MADFATSPARRETVLAGRLGGSAHVRLTPALPASRLSLRAPEASLAALGTALSLRLPTQPNQAVIADRRMALWLGPDEWLVIDENGADLAEALASVDALHAATDVSHRNTAVMVSGPGAEATLAIGCPQDLSLAAFPVGAASRTVFGKAEIVLLRLEEDLFRVECWRSFADYVFGLLSEGARDAGL